MAALVVQLVSSHSGKSEKPMRVAAAAWLVVSAVFAVVVPSSVYVSVVALSVRVWAVVLHDSRPS